MSAWSPFQHRVFRALWIALLVSNIGTWMQTVGAAWLMVELGASPAVVALVQTASYLPVVLVGVAAGAVADLVDRRRLLLVTQLFMLTAAAGLAVVTALDVVTPAMLLGFTFALGLGATFNYPAYQAIQPELVPPEELKQAVTLGGANLNLGRAIGPAVGGLLIAAAGVWLVFALNAVSFVAGVVVLWRWRRPVEEDVGPPERFAGAVRAGVRYALFSHALQGVLVRSFVFGLASAGLMSLLPVYAARVLGLGSGGLGLAVRGHGHRRRGDGGGDPAGARAPERRPGVRARELAGRRGAGRVRADRLAGGGLRDQLRRRPGLAVLSVDPERRLAGGAARLGAGARPCVLPDGDRGRDRRRQRAWGQLANVAGVPATYAWGALALVVTLALTRLWRFDAIARLDLSPAPMAAPEGRLIGAEDAGSPDAGRGGATTCGRSARTTSCAPCASSGASAAAPAR